MHIKAVIWDIGGVLARTEDSSPRDKLADDLGVSWDRLNHLVFAGEKGKEAQLGLISDVELWEFVREQLNLLPEEIPDLRERFFEGDIIDYSLVDYIRKLKNGLKTAILSNAWNNLRDVLENQWKIADAFDIITISGEEGVAKPDPVIFSICLNKLGVVPQEAIFIDDFVKNINSATSLGIHAIQFTSPQVVKSKIENLLAGN